MSESYGEITALLRRVSQGEQAALDRLIPLIYKKLRQIAGNYMRTERPDHTLQPTALVHEAFLRMVDKPDRSWQNRAHFIAVAAQQMRRLLIDHSRRRMTTKRGGARKIPLDETPLLFSDEQATDLLALDQALSRLKDFDPRLSQIVDLLYFGGLTVDETAEVIGLSPTTIKREWTAARAWLQVQLSERRTE